MDYQTPSLPQGDPDWVSEVRKLPAEIHWERRLVELMPPRKGTSYSIVSVERYLEIAASKGDHDRRGGSCLVVDGDLRIEGPKKLRGTRTLPRALVRGHLVLSFVQDLEEIDLTCCGGTVIHDCPSLRSLKGRYFGNTRVERCHRLERIGADFAGESDLQIVECGGLGALNCCVGNDLEARGLAELTRTGPAFSVGRDANFIDCELLSELGGRVARNLAFSGKGRLVNAASMSVGGRTDRREGGGLTKYTGFLEETDRRSARRGARGRGR